MKRILPLFLLLFLLAAARGCASLSLEQIDQIRRNNGGAEGIQVFRYGVVDWSGGSVTAVGKGPLLSGAPHDRLLAKRSAVSDARRNLLFLLYEMKFGLPEKLQSIEVSGEVVEGNIDFQDSRNGMFIVEVTVPLDRFLSESLIFSSSVR